MALASVTPDPFHAISEPNRRALLDLLHDDERDVGALVGATGLSYSLVSQHLQVLVSAGLVTVRKDGTRRLYQARPEGLAELREFLESFWDDHLLRLQRAAEAEQRRLDRDDRNPS